jgi:tetratricopeptide (TPR) repeat protein
LETAEIADVALNPETRRQLASISVKGKDRATIIERNLLLTALNWFEMERSNLLAAVEWAHQAEAWEIVVSLARNLVNFFNTHGYWADWERSHGLALEASRELGIREGEAETLINLGNVYSLQGNWEKASNCYEQSLGIFRELSNRHGIAKSLSNLGNVYSQQNSWEQGIERYKQSWEIFEDLGDSYRGGQTLANMGILYAQQKDPENAVRFWQESLTKLHPDLPKSKRVAQWLQSMKGEASPQTIESKPRGKLPYIVGASILIIILVLFLLFIFW